MLQLAERALTVLLLLPALDLKKLFATFYSLAYAVFASFRANLTAVCNRPLNKSCIDYASRIVNSHDQLHPLPPIEWSQDRQINSSAVQPSFLDGRSLPRVLEQQRPNRSVDVQLPQNVVAHRSSQ